MTWRECLACSFDSAISSGSCCREQIQSLFHTTDKHCMDHQTRGACLRTTRTELSTRSAFLFGMVLMLASAGCSGQDQPIRQQGVATLDGKPLAGATLTFVSTENKRPAAATTGEQGNFEIMTLAPGDGALRGEYKVVVVMPTSGTWGVPDSGEAQRKPAPEIHANYQGAATTPLRCAVPTSAGIELKLNKDGT